MSPFAFRTIASILARGVTLKLYAHVRITFLAAGIVAAIAASSGHGTRVDPGECAADDLHSCCPEAATDAAGCTCAAEAPVMPCCITPPVDAVPASSADFVVVVPGSAISMLRASERPLRGDVPGSHPLALLHIDLSPPALLFLGGVQLLI